MSLVVDEASSVYALDVSAGMWLDIEHDDHAQVTVLNEDAVALFESARQQLQLTLPT
jgi:hypothetical protein